ncbi:hypothetical protein Tco_0636802 [Tanacetum coccineum]
MANILQNHPLRFSIAASSSIPWIYLGQFWLTLKEDGSKYRITFSIAASSSIPWIYLGQFWLTLKEDGSKYRITFVLDRKEFTMTLDDFRMIFQLPQATNNNHERFVAAPKFSEMVPLFLNDLGFTLELISPSNFKTTGSYNHGRHLARCLHDVLPHEPLVMINRLCRSCRCYIVLLTMCIFTKLITGHYMTAYPEISKRVRDKYHNLEHDEMVKSIFNSGKNKAGVGMKIPSWMITDEMKLTENYRIIAEQKSHDDLEAEQNVEKVKEHLAGEEIEKMVEGTENVEEDEFVNYVLHSQNDLGIRLDTESYKEIPEVEKTTVVQPVNVIEEEEESTKDDYEFRRRVKGKHVEESRHTLSPTTIRSLRIHSTLISSDIEKLNELTVTDSTPSSSLPKPSYSIKPSYSLQPKTGCFKWHKSFFEQLKDAIQRERENIRAEFTSQINNVITNQIPSQVDSSFRSYMQNHVFHVHPTQASKASVHEQQYQLYLTLKDDLQLQQADLLIWQALKIKFKGLIANNTSCRSSFIRPRDQDDHHDDAHLEGENSAKRQKISEHETYVFGESSSGQADECDPSPSTSGNQEQLYDFDFWTGKYATDNDELPTEKVSQEIVEEMSEIVDEVKLRKVVDEMLRQRCTSGDEHQYHIDQMQNFLKNDIVWESIKETLTLPFLLKPTPVVQSCQRDPKALALSLVNQDLLYLKKGNSGPENFMLSLHKFPVVIFPDDDIKERTSTWVDKCMKKFNPYARYSIEHWKNPHAKIFYIKRQKN